MPRLIGRGPAGLKPVWAAAVTDHVAGLSWSADGRRLAAAAVSGPVAVVDATAGRVLHTLPGHRPGTAAVGWQPGGKLVATAGQDGTARLWDADTGAEVAAVDGGARWVEHVCWHPAGHLLATGAGRSARVWDPAGRLVREFGGLASTVADLAWQPGAGRLSAAVYGGVVVGDPAAADGPDRFDWKGSPLKLAWSPDGAMLAHGNQDSTVHFWYAATGKDLQMWGYPTKVRELSWEFTGRYLATGGGPAVCVWDCGGKGPEGSTPRMLEGHEGNLTAVAYQARGYLLASAGADGRVLVWQPANKRSPRVGEFRLAGAEAVAVAWSPDDRSLAVGGSDGTVTLLRAG